MQGGTGRFEDPPVVPDVVNNIRGCDCCDRLAEIRQREFAVLGAKATDAEGNETGSRSFQSVTWHGLTIKTGDALFLEPDTYVLRGPDGQIIKKEKVDPDAVPTNADETEYDEDKYPEKYRKTDLIKGSNNDTPEPFCIGYVVGIAFKGIIRKC